MWKPGAPSHALVIALPLLAAPWSATAQTDRAPAAKVDGAFIRQNEAHSKEWPTIGLDYAETRLQQAQADQRRQRQGLGLVWSYNLESTRGVEATPLVVDGVMYVSASWSVVHAVDVRTGKRLWVYRSEGAARDRLQGLLRRRQSRRRAAQGQSLCRRL